MHCLNITAMHAFGHPLSTIVSVLHFLELETRSPTILDAPSDTEWPHVFGAMSKGIDGTDAP